YPVQQSAEPDPSVVAAAFELTPAEAQVAAQLARGVSAVEIAAERGVSTQTIRAQIRAVFEKTGIKRQSDLIRLLFEMPDADPPREARPEADTNDRPDGGADGGPDGGPNGGPNGGPKPREPGPPGRVRPRPDGA